jgi:hypothetical protein
MRQLRRRQRVAQQPGDRAGRQEEAALAGLEHPRQAHRRAGWIERHINRAGLQGTQQRDDCRRHFRHQQRNAISSPASGLQQQVCQPVARILERAVGHPGVSERQRCRLGTRLRLRRDAVLQQGAHAAQRGAARANVVLM